MAERVAQEERRREQRAPVCEPGAAPAEPARAPMAEAARKASEPATPEQAAGDIRRRLETHPPVPAQLDEILTTLQLLHPRLDELKAAYERQHGIALERDMQLRMPGHALARARLVMAHGTIRLADKLFLAVSGDGTDEGTLMRLLPSVQSDPKAEEEFTADYGHHYRRGATRLPDGSKVDSAILSMLREELEDWELDQALALYARGKLRPVDEIRIATNRYGTEEGMLYAALEKGMEDAPGATPEGRRKNLAAEFAAAYPDALALGDLLEKELSFGELERAQLILEGKAAEGSVVLAIAGLGTDVSTIMKTVAAADPGERQRLHSMYVAGEALAGKPVSGLSGEQRKAARFYQDLVEDLDAVDLAQLKAVLAKKGEADTATELLAQAGAGRKSNESRWWGSAQEDFVDAIRDAGEAELKSYRQALECDKEFQERFRQLDEEQQSHVRTMLTGTLWQKIYLATGTWKDMRLGTDKEYIFDAIRNASDAEKREIAADDELMGSLRYFELGTADYNKLLDLLRTPESETLEERVENTQAQVERERSGWTSGMNAEWALRDEARELDVRLRLAKRDGSVSRKEHKRVLEAEKSTLAALETYVQARDEVEAIAAQVITTAAGIIVTFATFGAGAIAVTALNVAKAAATMAVTRVLATKIAHGDRFDVFGTDGATAFAAGAIEGAAGVLAAVPASAAAKGLLPVAETTVKETADATFRKVGRQLIAAALEGGISAAPGAVFETTVQATEMRGRIEDKLTHVGLGTVTAVMTSAATSTAMQGAAMGLGALLPDAPDVTPAPEATTAAPAKEAPKVNRATGPTPAPKVRVKPTRPRVPLPDLLTDGLESTPKRKRALALIENLERDDRERLTAELLELAPAARAECLDALGEPGPTRRGTQKVRDVLTRKRRAERTEMEEHLDEEAPQAVDEPEFDGVETKDLRKDRSQLRKRMKEQPLPPWVDPDRDGKDWNAHHIFPVKLENHRAFEILKSQKPPMWDHHDPDLNGIALPTDEAGRKAAGLPEHQMKGSWDVRGHGVTNDRIEQDLDALEPYFDKADELRRQVLKLRVRLVAEMMTRGLNAQP